jgi:hypothetical protein
MELVVAKYVELVWGTHIVYEPGSPILLLNNGNKILRRADYIIRIAAK